MKKVIADIDIHSSTPEWYWTRGLHDAQILKKQYINRYEGEIVNVNEKVSQAFMNF